MVLPQLIVAPSVLCPGDAFYRFKVFLCFKRLIYSEFIINQCAEKLQSKKAQRCTTAKGIRVLSWTIINNSVNIFNDVIFGVS